MPATTATSTRNTGSGWQKYDNGSWNTVNKSTAQASAQSYEQSHPNAATNASRAQNRAQSYDQSRPSGSSGYSKPSGGSYGDLDQEAQDRARGDNQSHNWSQSHNSGGFSSDRSGGGDRWGGGGGRSFGGGGFRR